MQIKNTLAFQGIHERNNEFLALFPHRFDYIYAEHAEPGASPSWLTESRHPLSDRLIQQGSYLYGVRFSSQTRYCLLDIDAGSAYHPDHDPFAIARIAAALESLGLTRYLACTSSYSGGLHLYFPFEKSHSSWQLAIVIVTLLENAGFKVIPGQLEVFPNPKPYSVDGKPNLFNAHRLPMQTGSYLLDEAFQPIWSNQQSFVRNWLSAQSENDLDTETLKQVLRQAKRRHLRISGKADKFINDLNAEIELGWTDYGQTNRLLGRITMRSYIFSHVLSGNEALTGQRLVEEIVRTARSLPGYQEWCQHQHEIEHRAEEWARCIENSHYFHYGDPSGKFKAKLQRQQSSLGEAIEQAPTWNQQQSDGARDRIRNAIADLLEKDSLPTRPTARFRSLLTYGIGGASLYRHRDLWHPNALREAQGHSSTSTDNRQSFSSLLSASGGDSIGGNTSSDRAVSDNELTGSNLSFTDSNSGSLTSVQSNQQELFTLEVQQNVCQEAIEIAQQRRRCIKAEVFDRKQIARMQQFLISDDPILVAEAMAWSHINPDVLDASSSQLSLSLLPLLIDGRSQLNENRQ